MRPDDQCADSTLDLPMILVTATASLFRLAKRLAQAYPCQADGKPLFPFRRPFIVAVL